MWGIKEEEECRLPGDWKAEKDGVKSAYHWQIRVLCGVLVISLLLFMSAPGSIVTATPVKPKPTPLFFIYLFIILAASVGSWCWTRLRCWWLLVLQPHIHWPKFTLHLDMKLLSLLWEENPNQTLALSVEIVITALIKRGWINHVAVLSPCEVEANSISEVSDEAKRSARIMNFTPAALVFTRKFHTCRPAP